MSNNADIDLKQQVAQLSRAMKFGFFTMLIGVSILNIFWTIFISPQFEQIFHDMLGGSPLPAITAFIFGYHVILIALSLVLLLAGILICWFATSKLAFDLITALMLVTFIHIAVTLYALFVPMVSVVA